MNSERVTFYQFDPKQNLLIGQLLLTGGQTRELKLAPEPKSIAGYVAMTKRTVNIHNVYDDAELKKLNSNLSFLKGRITKLILPFYVCQTGLKVGVLVSADEPHKPRHKH